VVARSLSASHELRSCRIFFGWTSQCNGACFAHRSRQRDTVGPALEPAGDEISRIAPARNYCVKYKSVLNGKSAIHVLRYECYKYLTKRHSSDVKLI